MRLCKRELASKKCLVGGVSHAGSSCGVFPTAGSSLKRYAAGALLYNGVQAARDNKCPWDLCHEG